MRLAQQLQCFARSESRGLAAQLLRFARDEETPADGDQDKRQGHEEIDLSPEEEEDLEAAWEALEDDDEPEEYRRRGLSGMLLRFVKDAQGHEHKDSGPGGGQFTSSGGGVSASDKEKKKAAGKPTPSEKKFGKSKAKIELATGFVNSDEEDRKEIRRAAIALFGKNDLSNIPSLVGAPDNATVYVFADMQGGEGLAVTIVHPDYEAARTIGHDDDGDLYIDNDSFSVNYDKRGQGLGSEIFGRQVENAIEAGVKYISTQAVRRDSDDPSKVLTGYKAWPQMGYDAPIAIFGDGSKIYEKIKEAFPEIDPKKGRILDIIATKKGRDWWAEHGVEVNLRFDLTPGSRSLKVLAAYQAERAKRPPKGARQTMMFRRRGLAAQLQRFAKDAQGHEHKGAGPGGGQFTSTGGGGSKKESKPGKTASKGGPTIPKPISEYKDLSHDKVMSLIKGVLEFTSQGALDPSEYELVELPLKDITPSQFGEDYDNSSSRELAKHIGKFGTSDRSKFDNDDLDYAPIRLDENLNIIDGNHRHAARTFAGMKTIPALVPKKKAAAKAPKLNEPAFEVNADTARKRVSLGKPAFPLAERPYDRAKFGITRSEKTSLPVEEVPIDKIMTVQKTVSPANVAYFLQGGAAPAEGFQPYVVQTPEGYYYLEDGNTRLTAEVIKGKKSLPIKVLKIGADGKWTGKETPKPAPELPRKLTQSTMFIRNGLAQQLRRFARPPARYRPWREEEPIEYAAGEHWVTIGAQEGEDGKKHGGSPVLLDGAGNILKGHGNLTKHKSLKSLLLQTKKRGGGPPEPPKPPPPPRKKRIVKPPEPPKPPPPLPPPKPPPKPPAPPPPTQPPPPRKRNWDVNIASKIQEYGEQHGGNELHAKVMALSKERDHLEKMDKEVKIKEKQRDDLWRTAIKASQARDDETYHKIKEQHLALAMDIHDSYVERNARRKELREEAHAHMAVPTDRQTKPTVTHVNGKFGINKDYAYMTPSKTSKSHMKTALDWIGKNVADGPDKMMLATCQGRNKRAFHQAGVISLDDGVDGVKTAIHEFGHHIEEHNRIVYRAAQAFLDYRCQGEAPQQLKKLFPKNKYEDGEYGRKDQFDKHFKGDRAYYVGKRYRHAATEIVSMGLEAMYRDPVGFARDDPEYFKFMSAVMQGHIK